MSGRYLIILSVTAALCTISMAASYSMSCIYINGEEKCTSKDDPNGNMAGSAAGVYGNRGMVASGAGNRDDFNVNRDQIGYGGGNQGEAGNYPPFSGFGVNNQGRGRNPNFQSGFGGNNQGGGGFPYFPQGFGNNGGGGMAVAGSSAGNFNPRFPQLDFPINFVRDFMG